MTPLEQAQAVLKTLQMILALVVAIPRAVLEGLTGQTISEIQTNVSQTDINELSRQLTGFASAVATVLISLLKVVAKSIAFLASGGNIDIGTTTAAAAATAATQEDMMANMATFVLEDLLPAVVDGLVLILQQFVMLLLEGGSMVVAAL